MLTVERVREHLDYDPLTGVLIWRISRQRIAKGSVAGTKMRSGHIRVKLDGVGYLAHRLAWLHWYGVEPPPFLDHIDRCPENNAIANLRAATKAQNGQNRRDSRGVSFHKATKKWQAYITNEGVTKYLGLFLTMDEAISARHAAMQALWTHMPGIPLAADGGAHRRYGLAKN
jgi:hypothetical protein